MPSTAACLRGACALLIVVLAHLSPGRAAARQEAPATVDPVQVDAVREAVVRYQVAHLTDAVSKSVLPRVTVLCLGMGRFGGTAPSPEFIDRFRDITPRLTAATACRPEESQSNDVALPLWVVSESLVRPGVVDVRGRVGTIAFKYLVEFRAGEWRVTSATQTGRGTPRPPRSAGHGGSEDPPYGRLDTRSRT